MYMVFSFIRMCNKFTKEDCSILGYEAVSVYNYDSNKSTNKMQQFHKFIT
jgi:hypothetical protein